MAKHNASIDILIPHTIHYTKVENQKESFKKFLRSADGIDFRKNTKDKAHSVSSYISNLERFSKTIAEKSNTKDFDLFCFCGANEDIDKIFECGKRFFEDSPSYINDCHSAIKQYKKFNSQILANKEKK